MRENMKEKKFFNYHIIRKENIVTMKEQDTIKKKKKRNFQRARKLLEILNRKTEVKNYRQVMKSKIKK